MPKSSYQKLKDKVSEKDAEYKRLRDDFKRAINGDFMIATQYKVTFKMEDQLEEIIWAGDSSTRKKCPTINT